MNHLESAQALPNSSAPIPNPPDQTGSTALLKTKTQKGPKHPCSKGRRNPLAEHPESRFWLLHPHLRPDKNASQAHHSLPIEPSTPAADNTAELSNAFYNTQLYQKGILPDSKTTAVLPPVLDSGASHHIVNDPKYLLTSKPINLQVGSGSYSSAHQATAIGIAKLIDHEGSEIVLKEVLLIPDLNRCLISMDRLLVQKSNISRFGRNSITINIDGFQLVGSSVNHLLEICGT